MKKSEVILELKKQGVVAVIRGESFDEGVNISKACVPKDAPRHYNASL